MSTRKSFGLILMIDKVKLEILYNKYNRREFVHPDPLEFLYNYGHISNREIAGLIVACLAYGRVQQILKSVSLVLERLSEPVKFINDFTLERMLTLFSGFKHRFSTGQEIAFLLYGIKRLTERYGSLNNCFLQGLSEKDNTIIPALSRFIEELVISTEYKSQTLIPSVKGCSACKRINLYLRWMIRKDDVDPGGWVNIPTSKLIIPLDTHMHRICLQSGITKRRQADMKTACEITGFFRDISPHDPVKYDFALTRAGIWGRNLDI